MEYPRLSNPPIRESIFSVHFAEQQSWEILKQFIECEEVKTRYGKINTAYHFRIAGAPNDSSALPQAEPSIAGFSAGESQADKYVIIVRLDSLSLHWIGGTYHQFETQYKEFGYLWELFSGFVSNPQINGLSLRYLNDLPVPATYEAIRLIPLNPFESNTFNSFLQINLNHPNDDTVKATVIQTVGQGLGKAGDGVGMVLDVNVHKMVDHRFDSVEALLPDLQVLRSFKNYLFFTIVPPSTLQPFV